MNITVGVGENGLTTLGNSSTVVVADKKVFTMWCDGDSGGWDVCKWYRPNFGNVTSDSDSCLYAVTQGPCPQAPGYSHWEVDKRSTRCSLTVGPVNSNDVGLWKCLLLPKNSEGEAKFQEAVLEREDIRVPDIKFDPGGDLTLHDGDSHTFVCNTSASVNMEPSSHWLVGSTLYPGSVTVTPGDLDQGVSSWTVISVLAYTASLPDSRRDIQCVVTLSDDFGNLVAFSVSWSGLVVSPGSVLKSGFPEWKILLIVLVPLFFILLLIILIVSCWFFGLACFSGKKKEKSRAAEDPGKFYATAMQSPIPSKTEIPLPSKRKPKNYPPYIDIDSLPPTREPQPGPPLALPWDPYSDCPDQLVHFTYEGDNSLAGSLSSLGSRSDEDRDLDMGDIMGRMGRQFDSLARLYREESSEGEEEGDHDHGQGGSASVTVSHESWV